jgi:hypothetical protein
MPRSFAAQTLIALRAEPLNPERIRSLVTIDVAFRDKPSVRAKWTKCLRKWRASWDTGRPSAMKSFHQTFAAGRRAKRLSTWRQGRR